MQSSELLFLGFANSLSEKMSESQKQTETSTNTQNYAGDG